MEFGGARKRGRPDGTSNGNGGFKKSKQGSCAHCFCYYSFNFSPFVIDIFFNLDFGLSMFRLETKKMLEKKIFVRAGDIII